MTATLHWLCLVLLAALMVAAAVGDWRRFTIPNRLNIAVAALALPYWLTAGVPLWPLLGWQLALALAAFALFALAFRAGAMGGGDVKLFAALALWFPTIDYLRLVLVVTVLGGLLTLALLVDHKRRGRTGRPEIPYGIAIALGTLAAIAQPIVNHFPG
jgi:prepilin peptidase CpaA